MIAQVTKRFTIHPHIWQGNKDEKNIINILRVFHPILWSHKVLKGLQSNLIFDFFLFEEIKSHVKATLDEGPRSRDQWIQTILLVKNFKLVPKACR